MTPRVSSYTMIFAVQYVPITVTGTVSTVTGTVSQFQTRGIPVRNLTNYTPTLTEFVWQMFNIPDEFCSFGHVNTNILK